MSDNQDRDGIDAGEMDLSPRPVEMAAQLRRERARSRRGLIWGAGALLVVLVGLVVFQGLGNATLYFRNADEAVAERSELGDRRFRLQGSVRGETIEQIDGEVRFEVEYNEVRVPVHHLGDPPELFQPGIPVVLEGRWSSEGDWFDSSLMIVRHTNEYEADYGERLDEAVEGSSTSGE